MIYIIIIVRFYSHKRHTRAYIVATQKRISSNKRRKGYLHGNKDKEKKKKNLFKNKNTMKIFLWGQRENISEAWVLQFML